jgi:hypothetical protein
MGRKRSPSVTLITEGLYNGGAGNREIVDHFERSGDTMQYIAKS